MSQDCNPTKKLKTEETDMNNEDALEHKETYVALSQGGIPKWISILDQIIKNLILRASKTSRRRTQSN